MHDKRKPRVTPRSKQVTSMQIADIWPAGFFRRQMGPSAKGGPYFSARQLSFCSAVLYRTKTETAPSARSAIINNIDASHVFC
jgi:hypothetical protein